MLSFVKYVHDYVELGELLFVAVMQWKSDPDWQFWQSGVGWKVKMWGIVLSKLTNSDDCPVNLIKIENGKDADLWWFRKKIWDTSS